MNERTLAVLRRFELPTALPDINHNTPLHHAALSGIDRAVQSLIDVGEEVDPKNVVGRTPLHLACSTGKTLAVKMLIRKGRAYVDARDDEGHRPLTLAVVHGHVDVVQYLLSEGTDIVNPNQDGMTPLMEAVQHEQINILEILLENGADVDTMDDEGQTALHMAVMKTDTEMASLLLDYGADPVAENYDAITPLDLANHMIDHEMVEILRESLIESDDSSDVDSFDAIANSLSRVILEEQSRTEIKENQSVKDGKSEVKSSPKIGMYDTSIEELISCPITLDIMQDPVMASDGYFYERSAISSWLQSHGSSPLTKQRMSVDCLMPARPLKHFIQTCLNSDR